MRRPERVCGKPRARAGAGRPPRRHLHPARRTHPAPSGAPVRDIAECARDPRPGRTGAAHAKSADAAVHSRLRPLRRPFRAAPAGALRHRPREFLHVRHGGGAPEGRARHSLCDHLPRPWRRAPPGPGRGGWVPAGTRPHRNDSHAPGRPHHCRVRARPARHGTVVRRPAIAHHGRPARLRPGRTVAGAAGAGARGSGSSKGASRSFSSGAWCRAKASTL